MSDQAKKDLADAYRLMMESAAWKHFDANILGIVEQQALRDEDSTALGDLTVASISECRGRRNAIRKIKSDVAYIVNEQI